MRSGEIVSPLSLDSVFNKQISVKTAKSMGWLPEPVSGCLIQSATHFLWPLISDGATPISIS